MSGNELNQGAENELNQDAEDATDHPHDIQLYNPAFRILDERKSIIRIYLATLRIYFATHADDFTPHYYLHVPLRLEESESSLSPSIIMDEVDATPFNNFITLRHLILICPEQSMLNNDLRFILEAGDQEAAGAFKCPITHEWLSDPVTPEYKDAVATDNNNTRYEMNHVFERSALLSWFRISHSCPLTRVQCTGNMQNRPDITDAQVKFIQEEKERLLQDIPKRQGVVDRYYGLVPSRALSTPFLLEARRQYHASGLLYQQIKLGMGY